ncbi:unnamed protein product [Ceutorhynchus assimilis]|uniref:Ionotropic receptor n=1 Tax=Ceutorhynchus assimilis TaxID=467358 RepID=A0A9N9MNB3_9CUCU|nr:unnamed protein product [Ceutorhynchus assimilis]
MLHTVLLVLVFLPCLELKIQYLPIVEQENIKFEEYLKQQDFTSVNVKNCIAVVHSNISQAKDIINNWQITEKMAIQVLNAPIIYFTKDNTIYEHTILLVRNLKEILNLANLFLNQSTVWYSDPKYHVLLLKTKNMNNSAKELDFLWENHRILNFVLVFVNESKNLQKIYYNVFNKKLSKIPQNTNKIIDMKGYKIRTPMDRSSKANAIYENGKCIAGRVCNLMNPFLKFFNADIELVIPQGNAKMTYTDIRKYISSKKVDISFTEFFFRIEFTIYAPYSINPFLIVGLVPKAPVLPPSVTLFYIFHIYVWILIIIFKIFFIYFFHIFPIIKLKRALKLLLLCSYVYSIIFQNTFQGAVITALTTPKFFKDVNTVDELAASGLKVYVPDDWQEFVAKKLEITHLNFKVIGFLIWTLKETQACYVVTDWWGENLLLNKTKQGEYYSKYYHLTKDALGAGRITYLLARNSPFKKYFNTFLFLMNDFGLFLPFAKQKYQYKNEGAASTTLNLEHLYGAFLLLICGLCFSMLVFWFEIISNKKYLERKNKMNENTNVGT